MKTRHFDRIGNGGIDFTELGFGTAPLGNLYRAVPDEDANATLEAAWATGCRYYDTAPLYGLGLSETRLNPFLRGKKRDDYVLSSKVGRLMRACPPEQRTGIGKFFDTPTRREVYDYSYDGVMRSFEASLERLGVDRIDILFVHDLDIFTHGSKEASDQRIEEFMALGLLRPAGAARPGRDQGLRRRHQRMGGLPDAGRARRLRPVPAGRALYAAGAGGAAILPAAVREARHRHRSRRPLQFRHPGDRAEARRLLQLLRGAAGHHSIASARIEAVCKRHGVRLIEAALQFPLLHPSVVSVIPGGQRPSEVESNRSLLDAKLPAALWADLKQEGLMRADAPVG